MNYTELASVLTRLEGGSVFITCKPEILDFTDKNANHELLIIGSDGLQVSLLLKDDTLPMVASMLAISIFSKGSKILTWNWKSLASFIRAKTGKLYSVEGSIIDLKVLESYSGVRAQAPTTLPEALQRLKKLLGGGFWKEAEPIYKNIHLPLLTAVLPSLEAIGAVDTERGCRVHACYEIDGQQNGRLLCTNAFQNGFVPHAMTPATREVLKPRDPDQLFMSFDFRGMEVFTLAHISKDEQLLEACHQPDIYIALFEKLARKQASCKEDREFAKKCFLPVIYGMSAYTLAQRCGVAIDIAEMVVERISSLFPAALAYVAACETQVREKGFAKDCFGKCRTTFEPGKEYQGRNFAVQSPGSTLCLEKLIDLHVALKSEADIAYTVHDGYVVYATKENWKQIYSICTKTLTAESRLCPGLRMKVSCRAGRNLNDLKPLGRKE